ncbi:unnamed protein product [Urochloa humidicola]
MSKRKSQDERCGNCAAKRPPKQAKQQHLYLLVDDWERGYSIRKLDIGTFEPDADAHLPPKPFTEPPMARIEALHEISCDFVSHGTKIFAMQPGEAKPAIPAFDTHTLGLTICLWPSCKGDYVNPLFASVAGKLFLFTDTLAEALGDPPPYDSKAAWSWNTIVKARPPFYTGRVLCHALHRDGRTLFVSAGSRQQRRSSREHSPEPEQGQGTFSFDAERLEWRRHGEWVLPFTGEAHFDAELEAWVGLCGERGDGAGRLCSCDVAPVAAEITSAPAWKLGREKLFRKGGPQLHLGARLLYMGGDSKFCLVESLLHEADGQNLDTSVARVVDAQCPRPRRRVLRISTFGLKYSKKGELQTKLRRAGACRGDWVGPERGK